MPPRRTKASYDQTTGIPVEIWTHELIPMIDVVSLWALSRTCKGFLAAAPTTRWKFRGVNSNKVSELALYAHQHPGSSLGQFIRKDVKKVLVMDPLLYEIIGGRALSSAARTNDYRLFYYAWHNGAGPECSRIINGHNVLEGVRGLGSRHFGFWTALSRGDKEAYMSATIQEVLSCAPTLEQFGIIGMANRTKAFFMEYLSTLRETGLITAPHEIKIPNDQLSKTATKNIVAARDKGLLQLCSDPEKRHVWVGAMTTPEHVLAAVVQGYTVAVSDLLRNKDRIPALLPLINAQEVAKMLSYQIGDGDGGTAEAAILAATLMLFPREVVVEATAECALARIALGLPFDVSASRADLNMLLNVAIMYNSPAVDLLISYGAVIDRDWSSWERSKLLSTAIRHNNLSSVKATVASGARLYRDRLDFGAISADIREYLEGVGMSVYPSSVQDLTSVDQILDVWKYRGRM